MKVDEPESNGFFGLSYLPADLYCSLALRDQLWHVTQLLHIESASHATNLTCLLILIDSQWNPVLKWLMIFGLEKENKNGNLCLNGFGLMFFRQLEKSFLTWNRSKWFYFSYTLSLLNSQRKVGGTLFTLNHFFFLLFLPLKQAARIIRL